MIRLLRTDSQNKDFIALVRKLDAYLTEIDGPEHVFYAQLNTIDKIKFAVVAYENEMPVGCGAMRAFGHDAMEVKRMYVTPERRGTGIARQILSELEAWASEMSIARCVLETGRRQPEAIRLYTKSGYHSIPNYGQYENVINSVCFEKALKK